MKFVHIAAMALAGLLASTAAQAADISERTIKVGIGLNDDHPQAAAVKKFGELVKQKSDGKITVKVFAGGTLGNDVTMISSLQGGTLEMTVPDTSTLVGSAGLEPFGLINLPFLFDKAEQADALLDGPFGQQLWPGCRRRGWSGWAFGRTGSGRSPTAAGRSTPRPTSPA